MTKTLAESLSVLLASLLVTLSVHADDTQKRTAIDALFANGGVANLRSKGAQRFRLRLEVHATHLTAKPVDGTYEEVWESSDVWERKISFPGFVQQEVGAGEGRWLARNFDFRPHVVYLLSRAIETEMSVSFLPGEQVKKFFERKTNGAKEQCAELKRGSWERTLCFDSRGSLASSESEDLSFEYADFQDFAGRRFPAHIRVHQNGETVLEIKMVELAQLTDAAPTKIEHVPNSRLMATCEVWERIAPAKKVQPQYPPAARQNHQQGTVTLYAALAADGSVERVKVLESAGKALDDASIQAVQQWSYAPLTCGPQPLPSETEIQVNYSLRVE
jgi:TonB family protein